MSRISMNNRSIGRRVEAGPGQDISQGLTYHQILNLNHDYAKENARLKNISNKLGDQLRTLHTQFNISPRDENTELYTAIN